MKDWLFRGEMTCRGFAKALIFRCCCSIGFVRPPRGQVDRWAAWRDSVRQTLRRFFYSPLLSWGLAAVQLAVIVVLIGVHPAPHRFKTLTSAALQVRQGLAVNVVFQSAATAEEIRRLLTSLGVVIVDGPTAEGLYTIVLPQHVDPVQALARLQKDRSIKFAAKAYMDGKTPAK